MQVIKNSVSIFISFFIFSSLCSADSIYASEQSPPEEIKGKKLLEARSILISEKWSPIETFNALYDGSLESELGMAGELKKIGIIEVAWCAGTGRAPCSFNYQKDKTCISVLSEGEYEKNTAYPSVVNWEIIDCDSLVTQKKAEPPPLLRK